MRWSGWALGAILLLLLPGCGRSEGEEFREDSLRPLQERLDRQRARVAATLRVVRPRNARDARALDEDVDALAEAYRRLAGLVPPAEVNEEFDAYTNALRDLIGALRRFPVLLRRGDEAGLAAAATRIQDATGAVQVRAEALERELLAV